MKKLFVFILLMALSVGAGKGIYHLKKGFSPRRIHSLEMHVAENWSAEAEQALTQTYSYIGRGRQCFAFASEDGKYVVKLPRTDIYKLPLWVRVLPFPSLRNRMRIDRAEREKFIIDSMHIAFEELQEQTAILAIHLGQSASKNKKLTLIDALGCKHLLPLEKTSFVLQYKRPILMKAFQEARRTGDTPQAQRILDALIAAVVDRAEKGILNRDRSFLRNYGFDGHKAYQIDIGSFFRIEGMPKDTAKHKSINDSMDAVKEWLTTNDPEMLPYLNEKLAALSGNSKS